MIAEQSVVRGRTRPTDLSHEQLVGMRGGSDNLDAARREVDHEERVVGHQAAPRPHFRREDVGAGDCAPMCAQERLPRGRPLWNGWQAVTSTTQRRARNRSAEKWDATGVIAKTRKN